MLRRMPRNGQAVLEGLETRTLFAAFSVTTTADSGAGSLRQAILDANANAGLDTISFAIGTGPQAISPTSALPDITGADGVVIAGDAQPGFTAGTPLITIDGSDSGAGGTGLNFLAGANTVIGVIVQNFDTTALASASATTSLTVLGSQFLGSSNGYGISFDGPNTRIGGPGANEGNLISGNNSGGILIGSAAASGAIIENNRIGTNAAGAAAQANGAGISLGTQVDNAIIVNNLISGNIGNGIGATGDDNLLIQNNTIGTNAAGTAAIPNGGGIALAAVTATRIIDNLISGNTGAGISVTDVAEDTVIQSNLIGTNAAGTGDLGNGAAGIQLGTSTTGASNNALIGGTASSLGNIIAFNGGAGIDLPLTGTGNSILGNSIFSNDGLGIDLKTSPTTGRTPNDDDDLDTGVNDLQNFPTLSSAVSTGGSTMVGGLLDSAPNATFRIEFFSDPVASAAEAEGKTFLGFKDVTTNSSGVASFSATLSTAASSGAFVTATATNANGSTSEFSDAILLGTTGPDIEVRGNSVVITNSDDTPSSDDFTNFGSSSVGTPITRSFSIRNTGAATLDLSTGGGFTVSGPGAAQFEVFDQPNSTVAANSTTTFSVRFTPSSAGSQSATLSLSSNDPDESPFTFTISGAGTTPTPQPEIEVSGNSSPIASGDATPSTSDSTDFGSAIVEFDPTPVNKTFTITNSGAQDLAVGGVTLSGTGAGQFGVSSQPASSTLTPGQSTTFVIRFAPSAGGIHNATVNIGNNDSNENPYTFAIRGQGTGGSDTEAPTATLLPPDQQPLPQLNSATFDFIVRYGDDQGLSVGSFDDSDISVSGPNGFSQMARFVSQQSTGTSQSDVTYRIDAPGGILDVDDDGIYALAIQANQVSDTGGNFVAAGALGTIDLDLASSRTSLGLFGRVNGHHQKITITEPDNTRVTISLSNGAGEIFQDGTRIDLDLTSSNGKLTITAKGGNGRAELNDVRVSGSLNSLVARTSDTNGVIVSSGALNNISLGSADGATLSCPVAINAVTILGNMSDSQVFSGPVLGADARLGGTGPATDAFGAGSIRKFTVNGSITHSLIAAGLDPVDGILTNDNGQIIGGTNSRIGSIKVTGTVDNQTVFAAGAYPDRARISGQKIDPLTDPRFDMTP